MPSVTSVIGMDSSCRMGFMDMSIRDSMSATRMTATHVLSPHTKTPGTIHVATPTAIAVIIQRIMKLISRPLSVRFQF